MGAAAGVASNIYSGYQKQRAADSVAGQYETEAGQSIAAGIQGAIQARRKGQYVASSANARIAAGGLATTGTSAIATTGLIAGQAEYNALSAMYTGQDRANELQARADTLRSEGKAHVQSGWLAGMTTVLTGGQKGTFFAKYGAQDQQPVDSNLYASDYAGSLV